MEYSSILGSTSFDKIYQIDSPWFPKKAVMGSSPSHLLKTNPRQRRRSRSPTDNIKVSKKQSDKVLNSPRPRSDTHEAVNLQQCASAFLFGATLTSDEQHNLRLLADKLKRSKGSPESINNQHVQQLRRESDIGSSQLGYSGHPAPEPLLSVTPPQSSTVSGDYNMTTPELPEWNHDNMTPLSPYSTNDSVSKPMGAEQYGTMPAISSVLEAEPWEFEMRNYINGSMGYSGDWEVDLELPKNHL